MHGEKSNQGERYNERSTEKRKRLGNNQVEEKEEKMRIYKQKK